jgi:hypothetical protein
MSTSRLEIDVLWASRRCQGISVAAIGRNWDYDNTPKTDSARLGIPLRRSGSYFSNPKLLESKLRQHEAGTTFARSQHASLRIPKPIKKAQLAGVSPSC